MKKIVIRLNLLFWISHNSFNMKTLISPISTLEADFETYHEDKHTILICIEISLMKLVIDGQHLKIFKNSPAAVWFFDIMFLCSNFACFSSIILVYYMLSFIVGLNFKFLKYVEISWENNIMDMKKSSRQDITGEPETLIRFKTLMLLTDS